MANEKRLIDANSLIAVMKEMYCDGCKNYNGVRCRACDFDSAMSDIEDAPTVDAVEVVHGKWDIPEDAYMGEYVYQCSVCKSELVTLDGTQADELWKYCPNCGAKMDGGKDNGTSTSAE